MLTRLGALGVVGALLAGPAPVAVASQQASEPRPPEAFLFAIEATGGSTAKRKATSAGETFTLRLDGLAPVTMFSDRPFRDAALITPKALVAHWPTWFATIAPNAVLTWSRPGQPPASIVVTLTSPRLDGDDLTFRAARVRVVHDPVRVGRQWQRPAVPSTMDGVSVFIDDGDEDDVWCAQGDITLEWAGGACPSGFEPVWTPRPGA